MARPKKRPDYNKDTIQGNYIKAVVEAYLSPARGTADTNGHMCMKLLADKFNITPIKVRKILITAGVYETAISRQVNDLYEEGKSVSEICKLLNLSVASVNGYLPYRKAVYSMEEKSLLAERLEKFRIRKMMADKFNDSMKKRKIEEQKSGLLEVLKVFAEYRFQMKQGVRFDYI